LGYLPEGVSAAWHLIADPRFSRLEAVELAKQAPRRTVGVAMSTPPAAVAEAMRCGLGTNKARGIFDAVVML